IAGREGRVERRAPVLCGTEASSVLQAVHLRMQYRAAPLHAPVVTAADDPAVEHEHCADRDAAAAEALPRFLDRRLQKLHAFSLPLNRPIQTIYSAELPDSYGVADLGDEGSRHLPRPFRSLQK